MARSVRLGELLIVFIIILVAFVGGSLSSSFIAATQVENHIDTTIAQTVKDAQKNSQPASAAAQKLFAEVDSICKSLEKNPAMGVHC